MRPEQYSGLVYIYIYIYRERESERERYKVEGETEGGKMSCHPVRGEQTKGYYTLGMRNGLVKPNNLFIKVEEKRNLV